MRRNSLAMLVVCGVIIALGAVAGGGCALFGESWGCLTMAPPQRNVILHEPEGYDGARGAVLADLELRSGYGGCDGCPAANYTLVVRPVAVWHVLEPCDSALTGTCLRRVFQKGDEWMTAKMSDTSCGVGMTIPTQGLIDLSPPTTATPATDHEPALYLEMRGDFGEGQGLRGRADRQWFWGTDLPMEWDARWFSGYALSWNPDVRECTSGDGSRDSDYEGGNHVPYQVAFYELEKAVEGYDRAATKTRCVDGDEGCPTRPQVQWTDLEPLTLDQDCEVYGPNDYGLTDPDAGYNAPVETGAHAGAPLP